MTQKTATVLLRGHPDDLASEIALAIENGYKMLDNKTFAEVEIVGGLGVLITSGEIFSKVKLNHRDIIIRVIRDLGLDEKFILLDNIMVNNPIIENDTLVNNSKKDSEINTFLNSVKDMYSKLIKNDLRFLPDGYITATYINNNDNLSVSTLTINCKTVDNCIVEEAESLLDRKITEISIANSVNVDEVIVNIDNTSAEIGFSRRAGHSKAY